MYSLPNSGSHAISLQEAIDMTTLYRQEKEGILMPAYRGQNVLCNSETFAAADVQALLNQAGCKGLRIYYGMKSGLDVHAILVGVNELGQDILPAARTIGAEEEGVLLEEGKRCPPLCPDDPGPLNP